MTTTVQYHGEYGRAARPAINVKLHTSGQALWPAAFDRAAVSDDVARYGPPWTDYIESAYERVQSDFWQTASEIAIQRGLGEIEQEGRSGGWLVFTDGRDPDSWLRDPNYDAENYEADMRDWLAAYRGMAEWAETYIADAPRKVRSLAQDLAMYVAGERTVALRSWLAWGRRYAL